MKFSNGHRLFWEGRQHARRWSCPSVTALTPYVLPAPNPGMTVPPTSATPSLRAARALTAVLAALLVGSAVGAPAALAAPAPAGSTGHDVSWPQCGSALPTSGWFGIVGVTKGMAFSANPCLGTQWQWASALPSPSALYTTPANPAPTSSFCWPTSGSRDPALCADATSTTDPGCAYDYGWHAAADALATATAAVPGAGSAPWWLDVETGNTYNGDGTSNAADLQGMIDYLRGQGVPSVGFYSTSTQWNQITGGWTAANDAAYRARWAAEFTPAYPMSDSPTWIAGLGSLTQAQSSCAAPSFTGHAVTYAQYADSGFDGDLACPPHTVPRVSVNPPVVRFGQTANVTITGTPGATVDLYIRKYQGEFIKIRSALVLDSTGSVTVPTKPDVNLRFQAKDVTVEQGSSIGGTDGLMTVQKDVSLTIRKAGTRRYTFTGSINPLTPGATVRLYRGSTLVRTDIPVSSSRAYSYTATLPLGTYTFTTRSPSTGYNDASTSPGRTVRIS